jgi:hypothetical protein
MGLKIPFPDLLPLKATIWPMGGGQNISTACGGDSYGIGFIRNSTLGKYFGYRSLWG